MMRRLAITLFLAAAAPAALAAQQAAPSGERVATAVFAKLPFMQGPVLSPDGSKVAMLLANAGTSHIAVIDLNDPNAKPTIIASAGERREVGDRDVVDWTWVGNDNVVMTLASRENIFGTRADVSRLVGYNLKTRQTTPLAWDGALGYASGILHIDHAKGRFLLERTTGRDGTERWDNPEVVLVDVDTGKFSTVVRTNAEVSGWYADGKGVVRAGGSTNPDNGKFRLVYRSNEGENFSTVFNEADKDFSGGEIVPLIFLDEPDMAYVTSNKDGFRKVYKANLETMALGNPIFEKQGYDVGGVIANDDRNQLLGVGAVEQGRRYYWMNPEWKEIQQYLDEGFGVGNVQLVSSDRGDKRFIVRTGGPNQAGAYHLYDAETGKFGRIGWVHNVLQDRKLNPVSTIRYRASDGETIPAVVTMPRHRTGKNLPLVILTHGGPFGVRDQEEYDHWAQAVAELGYVVVQPNYRGSGGYGKEWLKKGRNDGFGGRMQDDLNDAITHLAGQGIVDPARVCMMGWSYGGYASARAAQRDPDKYRCTIAGAGVYDLRMMKTYDAEYLGRFGANYLAKGAADLDAVSPAQNVKGKWAPIMIVHGVRDQRVPIAQSRTLVSQLKASGKREGVDFDYVEQPKNTHNLPYDDVRIEWLEATERWLTKHNPAYIASDPDKPVPVTVTMAQAGGQ